MKVYFVAYESGCYSDYSKSYVKAFDSEEKAYKFVLEQDKNVSEALGRSARFVNENPNPGYSWPTTEEYKDWNKKSNDARRVSGPYPIDYPDENTMFSVEWLEVE